MTVAELIERLKALPQDATVVVPGILSCEEGYSEARVAELRPLYQDDDDPTYYMRSSRLYAQPLLGRRVVVVIEHEKE